MNRLNCDFIFFTHGMGHEKRKILDSDWDAICSRKVIIEKIAAELDPKSKVLCIERPVSPFTTPLVHFSKFKRWILRKNIIRKIKEKLFVYLPYTFLPDSFSLDLNIITLINRKLLKSQIRRIIKKCKFESPKRIVWIYHPFQIDSLGLFNEDLVVFECHDEYASLDEPLPEKLRTIIKRKEIELLKRVDIVFVTSKLLYKNKSKYNSNTFYIPNAADIEFFRKAQDPNIKESDKIKGIRKPIIGYLGTIHNRTDIELLTYAAAKRPDWSFVLIGPREKNYEKTETYNRFKRLPNVTLLGWISYDKLPGVLKAFDVGVIPYKTDSHFNQSVNPLKLHEYTAMGKPIVSTKIPEVYSHKDIIKIANDKNEFIDLIEQSIQEDSKEKIMERLRISEKNSWIVRVDQMLNIIREKIDGKNKINE